MKNISCSLCYQKKKGECLLLSRSYKSSKHLRIYQKVNELEFEPGMKKIQSFPFSNQLKTFENSFINDCYEYL